MKGNKISDWKRVNWKSANGELKSLQAKLFEALKRGASKSEVLRIHNEILRSFSVVAVAVRKVTSNKGRRTRGIDKVLWERDEQKYNAILALKSIKWNEYKADPIRRVWIPKPGKTGEKRPLGIPTMTDRAAQTLWNFILDVHQEMNANPRSFGFRIGRSPKQAINYAWTLTSGAGKRQILKVDIRKAYDTVNHKWVVENVPMNRHVLEQWIKAGIIDKGKLEKPEMGVPQGGAISPTIFNIVMNGIEAEILKIEGSFPIRFADDLIVFSNEKVKLEEAKETIERFLKPRGLVLNEKKTELTTIDKGVDLLGYNIREYPDDTKIGLKGKPNKLGILLAKPSKTSIENFKEKLKDVFKDLQKASAARLIMKLNPIIRGWANYFNAGGGWTEAKGKLGYYIFRKLMKWISKKHKGKYSGKRALIKRYFKDAIRRRNYRNKWTFYGINDGNEILITDIQEILVNRENVLEFDPSPNPYNPADYAKVDGAIKRKIKQENLTSKLKMKLLRKQDGICPLCGDYIDLTVEEAERDHIIPLAMGGKDTQKNTMLLHKLCHKKKTAWDMKWIAHQRKIAAKKHKAESDPEKD